MLREGAHIIHADESRLQLFRHKPGQLDSLKDLNLEDLEQLREQQEQRLRELEYILFSGDDNSKIGKELRKKMTKQKREDEFAAELEAEKSDTEAPSPQKSVHSPVKT